MLRVLPYEMQRWLLCGVKEGGAFLAMHKIAAVVLVDGGGTAVFTPV